MIKTRDSVAIEGVGNYLLTASEELARLKEKFAADSNLILASDYQGIDANQIVARLLEGIDKTNDLLDRFEYYSKYMLAVAGYDRESIKKITKKLDSFFEDLKTSSIDSEIPIVDKDNQGGTYNV